MFVVCVQFRCPVLVRFFFFFSSRRRHTRYWRDWSSDVCSSDLPKFTVGDHWIDVPKLGRVNMAEQLRFAGKILSARISKTADWWFVSITVEMPDVIPENHCPPVGIDVGLNRLATLSDGRRYENQRPLRHLLNRLRRLNKELARRTKGGKK